MQTPLYSSLRSSAVTNVLITPELMVNPHGNPTLTRGKGNTTHPVGAHQQWKKECRRGQRTEGWRQVAINNPPSPGKRGTPQSPNAPPSRKRVNTDKHARQGRAHTPRGGRGHHGRKENGTCEHVTSSG